MFTCVIMGNRFLFILKTQQLSKDRLLYLPNLYTPIQLVSLRYQDTLMKQFKKIC